MKIFRGILIFAISAFALCNEMNAKEIRITPEQLAADKNATVLVRQLVDRMEDGSTLIFPQGTYHFYPEGAATIFCTITNNDNGVKRTPFPIIDKKNIVIDGSGSEFIFHGLMLPFIIDNSQDVTVKNLSIDWEYPFHIEGTVLRNDPAAGTFDVRINEGFHYRVDGLTLKIVGEGWEVEAGQNMLWDPATLAPHYNMRAYILRDNKAMFGDPPFTAVDLGDRTVRIKGTSQLLPPPGSIYVDKGMLLENRLAPAFRLVDSSDLLFTDITVYHAGAIGMIGEFCENVTLRRYDTHVREGGGRYVSTTADATHFSNCKGLVLIEDGVYRHMLDDATNIHGAFLRTVRAEGRVLYGDPVHHHRVGSGFARAGDKIRIYDNERYVPMGEATVLSSEIIHERLYKLVLDRDVSALAKEGFGIENTTWNCDFTFRNNKVYENRARSILISTPGKALVEGNYFSSQMCAIQVASDMNFWYESGPVNDILIRDNDFGDNGYGGIRGGVILNINPEVPAPDAAGGNFVNRNIRFTGNRINCFERMMVSALSVDGLVFEDNVIGPDPGVYVPMRSEMPIFVLESSRNVVVRNNKGMSKENLYSADGACSEINITAD